MFDNGDGGGGAGGGGGRGGGGGDDAIGDRCDNAGDVDAAADHDSPLTHAVKATSRQGSTWLQ